MSSGTAGAIDANGSELAPAQAAFRFAIEVVALVAWAVAGWHLGNGIAGSILAFALPLAAATLWGTCRVPGDHSADGGAPVPVSGPVRLVIEAVVLLGAAAAIAVTWSAVAGAVLAAAIVLHVATTPRRLRWMLTRRGTPPGPMSGGTPDRRSSG